MFHSPRYWTGYFLRRFCRIYPLYIVALVMSVAVTDYFPGYSPRVDGWLNALEHLVLLAGNSIYWAIPVEFSYYLLLPFVTLGLFWLSRLHISLPFVGVVLSIWAVGLIWPAEQTERNSIQLGPYLSIFMMGSLAAFLCTKSTMVWMGRYGMVWAFLGFAAIVIAFCTVPSWWRALVDNSISNQEFHRSFMMYGFLWSTAVIATIHAHPVYVRFFELPPWRLLGRISFSIYLWHYLIVQWVSRDIEIAPYLQFCLVITITMAVSYLSYRVIERPFILWAQRVSEDWLVGTR